LFSTSKLHLISKHLSQCFVPRFLLNNHLVFSELFSSTVGLQLVAATDIPHYVAVSNRRSTPTDKFLASISSMFSARSFSVQSVYIVPLKVELTHRTLLLRPTDNTNLYCAGVKLTIRLTRGRQ